MSAAKRELPFSLPEQHKLLFPFLLWTALKVISIEYANFSYFVSQGLLIS